MLISSIKYYITECFKSMFHNKIMFLISVSTVAVCLTLLGISMIFSSNLRGIGEQLQTQFKLQAFVDIEMSVDDAKRLEAQINRIDGVKKAIFESKDEAVKKLKEMYKEDSNAFTGLENDNPLRHSYKIELTDLSKADRVTKAVSAISGISRVINREDILKIINSTSTVLEAISIGAMLIFGFVAVFIISNTIKLAVHARRREIGIMKLVGATDWFIRWPFILEGIIVGLLGAVIPYLPLVIGYNAFVQWWIEMVGVFTLKPTIEIYMFMFYTFIFSGTLIGAVGSGMSIRKHLKI